MQTDQFNHLVRVKRHYICIHVYTYSASQVLYRIAKHCVVVAVVLQQSSSSRLSALQSLLAFVEEATHELMWLNDKEETETARDWSSKTLDVDELRHYHQVRT